MNTNTLGERIKHARDNAGVRQKDLAAKLGVTPQAVWRWEKGEREPSWEMIQKIAKLLNAPDLVKVSDVINEPDTEQVSVKKREVHDLPSWSYWGSVIDNAQNIAQNGKASDIEEVSRMLEKALKSVANVHITRDVFMA